MGVGWPRLTLILGPFPVTTSPGLLPQTLDGVLVGLGLQHTLRLALGVLASVIVTVLARGRRRLTGATGVAVEMSLLQGDENPDIIVDGLDASEGEGPGEEHDVLLGQVGWAAQTPAVEAMGGPGGCVWESLGTREGVCLCKRSMQLIYGALSN